MKECLKNNKPSPAEDIEAARLLIHLSSALSGSATTSDRYSTTLHESEEDDHHNNHSSCSNSGYSVLQWMTKGGAGADVSLLWCSEEEEIEDVLEDIEDDERLRRRNKRYRYLDDLYSVTVPVLGSGHGQHVSAAVTERATLKSCVITSKLNSHG